MSVPKMMPLAETAELTPGRMAIKSQLQALTIRFRSTSLIG